MVPSECDDARGLLVTSAIVGGSGAGTLVPVVARRGAQLVEILAERGETDFVHWIHLFTCVVRRPS